MMPWFEQLRTQASADFERLGIPDRHNEEWKYTLTGAYLAETFHANTAAPCSIQAPKGALVVSMAKALVEHAELVKPFLGKILKHTHGFHAQNTALFEDGLFVYLPEGVVLDEPLFLPSLQNEAHQARYIRHLIIAEPGAKASIIETYEGASDIPYFTNTMTEISVGEGAEVIHYKIQREGNQAYHVGEVAVAQATHSVFESHSFAVGGQWVRSDTVVSLDGVHAACKLNGIYAPTHNQHIDHHTRVEHAVPDCSSEEDYKGIVSGHARAVFNGKVIVAPGAIRTVAKQQNKNLLLSAGAEVDTKPELQIFADDVVCSHGATVGQLDESALFYLEARGIEPLAARRLLVQAFAMDNLRHMQHAPTAQLMDELLTAQLEG